MTQPTHNIAELTSKATAKGWKPFWKETAGLSAAEILSSSVAVGAVAYAEQIAPDAVHSATNAVAKYVIEPHLEFFKKAVGSVCRLQSCKLDSTESREERARKIARAVVLFGGATLPAFAVKVATRRGFNELAGLGDGKPWWNLAAMSAHDWKLARWDEGIHYGAVFVMNTLLPKPTDEMVKHTSAMTQKLFGWSKERADTASVMLVAHEVPNLLGFGAGIKAIYDDRIRNTLAKAVTHSAGVGV